MIYNLNKFQNLLHGRVIIKRRKYTYAIYIRYQSMKPKNFFL